MKVYIVKATITKRLAIVAESEEAARDAVDESLLAAEENADDCDADTSVSVELMTMENRDAFSNSIPYGLEDADERRDWTVEQWMEAKT